MSHDLDGRTIVVTGGSGSLGHAVVHLLAGAGARVVVPCIDDGPARGVEGVAYVPRIDLSEEAAVTAFYADLPPLWASIHVAGGFVWAKIEDTSAAVVREQWAMNAMTCFLCSREAVKKIRAGGRGGRIVNVSSRGALSPGAGVSAYAMAKAAVVALTQSLAEELREEGILVNAIAPGIIDTPANRSAMPQADVSRWVQPVELARTIHFLVSDANTATSGAVLPVYGRS